jgi:hypothetical protein
MISIDLQQPPVNTNSILSPPTVNQPKIIENQQNLKNLESLFNEIAMAHYSDQKSLEQHIFVYQEKYHKADYMMNLLFDNLNMSLNVS